MKFLCILAVNSYKIKNQTSPVVRYFTWILKLVSNILSVIVCGNVYNKAKGFSYFFNMKLEQLSDQKILKLALLGNCLSDLFTEVEFWYEKNFKFVLGRFLER